MFDSDAFAGHESIHHFYDEASGPKAIIAIHSTALGPGAGGCRMWNYDNAQAAMRDALRLSRGMRYGLILLQPRIQPKRSETIDGQNNGQKIMDMIGGNLGWVHGFLIRRVPGCSGSAPPG